MTSHEKPDSPGPKQYFSFEEAFDRLGKTVESLESGGLTLESATALYEEGMSLVEMCNQLLNTAELRVRRLKAAYSQHLSESEDGSNGETDEEE